MIDGLLFILPDLSNFELNSAKYFQFIINHTAYKKTNWLWVDPVE